MSHRIHHDVTDNEENEVLSSLPSTHSVPSSIDADSDTEIDDEDFDDEVVDHINVDNIKNIEDFDDNVDEKNGGSVDLLVYPRNYQGSAPSSLPELTNKVVSPNQLHNNATSSFARSMVSVNLFEHNNRAIFNHRKKVVDGPDENNQKKSYVLSKALRSPVSDGIVSLTARRQKDVNMLSPNTSTSHWWALRALLGRAFIFLLSFISSALILVLDRNWSLWNNPVYRWTAIPAVLLVLLWLGIICEKAVLFVLHSAKRAGSSTWLFGSLEQSLKHHLRYFILLLVSRIVWLRWLEQISFEQQTRWSLIISSLLIVYTLWIFKNFAFVSAIHKLSERTYYADVCRIALQERALERLCCDSTQHINALNEIHLHDSSVKGYIQCSKRVRRPHLVLPLRNIAGSTRVDIASISDWHFSEHSFVDVGPQEMTLVSKVLWRNLIKCSDVKMASQGCIDLRRWTSFYGTTRRVEAIRAFELLFDCLPSSGGDIAPEPSTQRPNQPRAEACHTLVSASDFETALTRLMKRRERLASSLENWENLTQVIRGLTTGIFWFIMIFVVSTVYSLDLSDVLVTLSTFILSIAFAFGPTMRNWIESAIFIFATQPFDVGDRISLGESQTHYFVVKISLLTTQLRSTNNMHVLFSNQMLAATSICNMRRSLPAFVLLKFEIGFRTPMSSLKALRKCIAQFLKQNPLKWMSRLYFFVTGTNTANSMLLKVIVESRLSWQEAMSINLAKSELLHHIREAMTQLGVAYENPAQPVRLTKEFGGVEAGVTSTAETSADQFSFASIPGFYSSSSPTSKPS